MSVGAAHLGMRLFLPLLLMCASCASPPTPATPALDVAGPSDTTTSSTPTVLERAQAGLLFVDAGPDGAAPVAADPHAHHHHHGHAAPVVDAGTP